MLNIQHDQNYDLLTLGEDSIQAIAQEMRAIACISSGDLLILTFSPRVVIYSKAIILSLAKYLFNGHYREIIAE